MIKLSGISRTFQLGEQTVRALDHVDLQFSRSEYISVMGPSGSGKSTLLNIIALLDHADAGSYRFDGQDVTGLADDELAMIRSKHIGFVFQFFHLIPRMSAFANVEVPLLLAAVPPVQRRKRVLQAMQDYGIADRANHRPDQLSGGQRQRVAIARATIMNPSVVLADEPTGNLDSVSGKQVLELLEKLNNKHGVTLIVVTHDPDLGARARRRVRIVDGRIASDTGAG